MWSEQDIYQSYEATPTTNGETPSVSHALEIFCISYWKLVKIIFIYRKLESMLDTVHCKLIWNDLRVNVFQIWWAQLKQQAARFQTFPFSANEIKFSKYLLKHVMWEGFKQSDIASMTPASRKAVLWTVPPKSLRIWCGNPILVCKIHRETGSFHFPSPPQVPSHLVPAVFSPVNTCNHTWCHVFLIWFFGPKWATSQNFGRDIHCMSYLPAVSWTGYYRTLQSKVGSFNQLTFHFWIVFTSHTCQ